MRMIYRYELRPKRGHSPEQVIVEIPEGATILHVGLRDAYPEIWAAVDVSQPNEQRLFRVLATGEQLPEDETLIHLGTVITRSGHYVWHVVERIIADD